MKRFWMKKSCCDNKTTFQCQKCLATFKLRSGLNRHVERAKCISKEAKRQANTNLRSAKARIETIGGENLDKHYLYKTNINTSKVELVPYFGVRSVGLTLVEEDGDKVIAEIDRAGLAFLSGLCHEDLVLEKFEKFDGPLFKNVVAGATVDDDLKDGEKLVLYFHRPDPPLDVHGRSRRVYRKASRYFPTTRQQQYCDKAIEKNPYASASSLFGGMKLHFGYELREDGTPMHYTKSYIKVKLAEKVKKDKQNRIVVALRAKENREASKEEPPRKKLKNETSKPSKPKPGPVKEVEGDSDSEDGEVSSDDSDSDGSDSDGSDDEEEEVLTDDDDDDEAAMED